MARQVIDVDAMGRAGYTAYRKGEDPRIERQRQVQKAVVDTAFNVLGSLAIGAAKKANRHLQKYRDVSESQTASLDLKIDKINPKNTKLKPKILGWKKDYDKAARCASFGIGGSKRSKCRAEMKRIMGIMHNANANLELYQANTKNSQAFANGKIGRDDKNSEQGKMRLNEGNHPDHDTNVYEQANGTMGMLLDFDENGDLTVIRNGDWQEVINDKGEKVSTYLPDGRGALRVDRYKDMKFGKGEDPLVEKTIKEIEAGLKSDAYSKDPIPWEYIGQNHKDNFYGFINSVDNNQFRDFFFGGFSHEFSSNRINTTSPAYKYLKTRAMVDDVPDGQGGYTNDKVNYEVDPITGQKKFISWKPGYGPGTTAWEGEMTALKMQNFDKDSEFRQAVAQDQWLELENGYKKLRAEKEEKDRIQKNQALDGSSGGPTRMIGGVQVSDMTFQTSYAPYIEFLSNPKEGQSYQSPRGIYATYKNGKFYADLGEGEKAYTRDGLAKFDYIVSFLPQVETASTKEEEEVSTYNPSEVDKKAKQEIINKIMNDPTAYDIDFNTSRNLTTMSLERLQEIESNYKVRQAIKPTIKGLPKRDF